MFSCLNLSYSGTLVSSSMASSSPVLPESPSLSSSSPSVSSSSPSMSSSSPELLWSHPSLKDSDYKDSSAAIAPVPLSSSALTSISVGMRFGGVAPTRPHYTWVVGNQASRQDPFATPQCKDALHSKHQTAQLKNLNTVGNYCVQFRPHHVKGDETIVVRAHAVIRRPFEGLHLF